MSSTCESGEPGAEPVADPAADLATCNGANAAAAEAALGEPDAEAGGEAENCAAGAASGAGAAAGLGRAANGSDCACGTTTVDTGTYRVTVKALPAGRRLNRVHYVPGWVFSRLGCGRIEDWCATPSCVTAAAFDRLSSQSHRSGCERGRRCRRRLRRWRHGNAAHARQQLVQRVAGLWVAVCVRRAAGVVCTENQTQRLFTNVHVLPVPHGSAMSCSPHALVGTWTACRRGIQTQRLFSAGARTQGILMGHKRAELQQGSNYSASFVLAPDTCVPRI